MMWNQNENKSLRNEGSSLLRSNNIVEDATIRCYDGLDTRSTSNIEAASPGDDGAGGNANRSGLLVKAATGRCHIHYTTFNINSFNVLVQLSHTRTL